LLKLFTLGGLQIDQAGARVSGMITRKVEAMLVYLAIERREVLRETLAELLWDNVSPAHAMGSLRTALSNLQTLFPDAFLISRKTVKLISNDAVWVDVDEINKAWRVCKQELTAQTLPIAQQAAELYKGSFLAGFHIRDANLFDEWQRDLMNNLLVKITLILQRLMDDALSHEVWNAGIDYAQQLLTLDPLYEKAYRAMMLALARTGQRAAASRQYEACVRLLREELDAAPEPETIRLHTQLQSENTTHDLAPNLAVHLPIPATPFIERPTEVNQLIQRLNQPDCHLLTIVGQGGIGKTRLALQAAAECASHFSDGTFFVSLASVEHVDYIPFEIASVLRYAFQGSQTTTQELIAYLATRELLLILDNFEHLLDGATLISDILTQAPRVKILVTSREWLNLHGEWIFEVAGMSYPFDSNGTLQDDEQYNAVQLFVSCARRIRPRFSLAEDHAAVVKICQLVEGMPLSIELAAGWLRSLPAAEIARQINPQFLATTARNAPERHRSVQTVFDHSWKMLSPEEAAVLMKLSVFKGPFSRAAAIDVATATIPILSSLIEKSLVRLVDHERYDIHQLLRQYAFARLTDADQHITTRNAHLNYYVRLTENPDSRIHGKLQTIWLDQFETEHDNLRLALDWALEQADDPALQAGLSIGASVWEFWLMRGHITEGRQRLERLLAATNGMITKTRGAVTQGAGYLTWIQGDNDRAEALHREGLAIRQAIDDKAGMGGSLSNLGVIAWSKGEFNAAREFYEQALAARREANYTLGMASVLNNLMLLMQDQGEYRAAIHYAEQALTLFNQINDLQGRVLVLLNMGSMTFERGDWEQARDLHQEALTLARDLGDRRTIGALLQNLGTTELALGDHALARHLLDEAQTMILESGDKTQLALVKRSLARLYLAENQLDRAQALIDECLALFTDVKAESYRGQALLTAGDIQRARHDLPSATRLYRQGLAVLLPIQHRQYVVEALFRLSQVAAEPVQAARLLGAADALAARLEIRLRTDDDHRATLPTLLAADVYHNAYISGAAVDLSELTQVFDP
jgi:predicted ATPase/DNA-binding SARP family transcriptional activator/uncharacterized protein HemY